MLKNDSPKGWFALQKEKGIQNRENKISSNIDLMDQWGIIEEILVSPTAFKASVFQTFNANDIHPSFNVIIGSKTFHRNLKISSV